MFKLRNVGMKFLVKEEEKLVIAFVDFQVINTENKQIMTSFTTHALARCSNGDIFTEKAGKQVARAKAEKKGYIRFYNMMQLYLNKLMNLEKSVRQCIHKDIQCIEHQDEYIKNNF